MQERNKVRKRKARRLQRKDKRKKVKRRRGQQLASAGLKLTSSFYKEPEEERRR